MPAHVRASERPRRCIDEGWGLVLGFLTALDRYAQLSYAAYRRELGDRNADPRGAKFTHDAGRKFFGELLDQCEVAIGECRLDSFDHLGVVDRITNLPRARTAPGINSDFQVEFDSLRHLVLPGVNADQCVEPELRDEDSVHGQAGDCKIAAMNPIVVALAAYLIGSVSFAVWVSRAFALPDPRSYGSGNPGATNVLRTGRKIAAVLTLVGDAGKGWLAVYLAAHYGDGPEICEALACVGVVLGHVFPVFHRFTGGKGVSTAAGALLALNAWLGLGTIATWIVIAAVFRISSLAALVAAVIAPACAAILFGVQHAFFWGVLVVSALLVVRHKENIANLVAGTEGRIGERNTGTTGQTEERAS